MADFRFKWLFRLRQTVAAFTENALPIVESTIFPPAGPLTEILSDGWRGAYDGVPTDFDPIGSPVTFTVTRPGFDASAAATTVNDTLTIMKRVRQPYPRQTSKTPTEVALSDFVYQGDSIAGVVNSSARAAPLPIAMWLDSDLTRAVGQSYTARLAVSHAFARSGRPVAAVRFYATDGTTTVSTLVSAMSKADYTASGLSVPHFAGVLNLSTLTANVLVKVYAIIYPWVGAAYNIDTQGATYPSANLTSLRVLNDNGSYGTAYAYVDPAGNNGTGVVSATPATAAANPYLTVAAAAAAIKTFNNTNYSRNNTSGGVIRLNAGTYTHADFSASTSGAIPLVIEATNPANKATTIYRDAGSSTAGSLPDNVKFKDITIKRNASGNVVFFDNGGLSSRLILENCTFDDSGFGASWGAYIYQVGYVWVVNCDGSEMGFAVDFSTDKKQVVAIGSTNSIGTVTYNLAGCKSLSALLTDDKFGAGNREASTGRFIGFNFLSNSNAPVITVSSTIGAAGLAIVGNVIEYTSGIQPAMQISESTNNTQNIVMQSTTMVGQRLNFSYNDLSSATKYASVKFCVFNEYNTKGDVFATNGAYVGNWPVMYHVGYRSNAYLRGDTQNDVFGVGEWLGEVAALGEATGTNATPIVADWVSDRSLTSSGLGNGDYTPGGSTALPFIPSGLAPHGWDLYGNAISNGGTSRVGARQVATGAAYTLTAATGVFTETGNAATLRAGRRIIAATGAFAETGNAATLRAGRKLVSATGAFAFTGNSATLTYAPVSGAYVLAAATGAFALTGNAATLQAGRKLTAAVGAFALTGNAAGLIAARKLLASTSAFALTGNAATLIAGRRITSATGAFAFTGNPATLRAGRKITAATGPYTFTGNPANLAYSGAATTYTLTAATGAFALTGQAATLRAARRLTSAAEVFALTGNAAGLRAARRVTADRGVFALSGQAAGLAAGRRLSAQAGVYALSGLPALFRAGRRLQGSTGIYALTGYDAGLTYSAGFATGAGSLYGTGARRGQIINGSREGAIINQIRRGKVMAGHQ